jgi:hypothetical protein
MRRLIRDSVARKRPLRSTLAVGVRAIGVRGIFGALVGVLGVRGVLGVFGVLAFRLSAEPSRLTTVFNRGLSSLGACSCSCLRLGRGGAGVCRIGTEGGCS